MAMQNGITHMVATPHANDTYTYSRDRARELVVELAEKVGDQLAFGIGCVASYCCLLKHNVWDSVACIETFRRSNGIVLDQNLEYIPSGAKSELKNLRCRIRRTFDS